MTDYYDKSDAEYLAAWQAMIPPARPSKGMQALYEKNLLQLNHAYSGDWGLLGCTPELRTMAGRYERPLTCIDINSNSYTALAPLCTPSEKEQFVKGDWLNVNLPEAFNLIMGDGSMVMLPQELYPGLIDNAYRMLKPGGHLVTRILSCDGQRFTTAEEALRWYYESYRGEEPLTSLLTDLWLICMNYKTMSIKKSEYVAWLKELHREEILTKEQYEELNSPIMNVDLHCTDLRLLEKLAEDKFEILSIESPNDFVGSEYYPVCTLRKI